MLGPLNHQHHHHHPHQHHQHLHKVCPSWQRTPQPSHRSLPNMQKHSKRYLALLQQGENNTDGEVMTSAYFSQEPPLEPIKLVLVGDFSSQAFESHKIQQLVKNCKAINFYKDAEYGSYPSSTFRPSSKETVTTEKSLAPTSSAIYSLNDTTKYSHRESKKDKKDVRQLLHQLIANLPVGTSTAAASETSILRTRSPSPVRGHRSSCSIAVQARMISTSEDKLTTLSTMDEVQGEEWMGGVRALRDSHVRLVQRQLRHIERLNRALDRVTKNFSKNKNRHVHF